MRRRADAFDVSPSLPSTLDLGFLDRGCPATTGPNPFEAAVIAGLGPDADRVAAGGC